MKKKKMSPLKEDEVRVIKIGEEALFEFIYEEFIDDQECYLDVEPVSVTDSFYIDWENRQFIFCAYKSENESGQILELPGSVDLEKLMILWYNENRKAASPPSTRRRRMRNEKGLIRTVTIHTFDISFYVM